MLLFPWNQSRAVQIILFSDLIRKNWHHSDPGCMLKSFIYFMISYHHSSVFSQSCAPATKATHRPTHLVQLKLHRQLVPITQFSSNMCFPFAPFRMMSHPQSHVLPLVNLNLKHLRFLTQPCATESPEVTLASRRGWMGKRCRGRAQLPRWVITWVGHYNHSLGEKKKTFFRRDDSADT